MDDSPNVGIEPDAARAGVPSNTLNQPTTPADPEPATLSPTEATAQPITKNSFPAPEDASFSTPWERTAPPAPTVSATAKMNTLPSPSASAEVPLNSQQPPSTTVTTSDGKPKQPGRFKALLSKRPIFLGGITLSVLIIGVSAFLGLKFFVLDRLNTLDLLPDDTRFYLSIAVKDNPQAKALKELIKKFPSGEKVITSFDKQLTDSLSNANDPFADFLRLDRNDLFLSQISRPDQNSNLISLSNLLSPAKATERLAKFEKDDTNVVRKISYQGQEIFDIHLKEAAKSALPVSDTDYLYPTTKSKVKTPKPPTIFTTALQQFIIAGPKEDDIKKISDLAKVKASLGLINEKKLKSLTGSEAHKTIAKNFPDQTFLKYYSNVPVTPDSSFLPVAGVNQSFLGVFGGNLTNPENGSNISENLVTGLTASVNSSGLKIDSFQLDTTKAKEQDAKNPFSLTNSLANQIPTKLNGMTPAFYAETRNMKQIVNDQIDLIKNLAENSDSRKQRESFGKALKEWEQNKKDIKKSLGLDFDNDILPLFEGQSALLFNAGGAKVAPELLVLTEVKDQTKAENSLKKLQMADYSGADTSKTSLTPIPTEYAGSKIYSIEIYAYGDIKINFYFSVTKSKAILALATTDQSVKELIDFESKPGETIFKTKKWQDRFGKIKDKVSGFAFVEPIQFWGTVDWITSLDATYTNYLTKDVETAYKAYLETVSSIDTVVTKKKPVYITTTSVHISELPTDQKKAASGAIDRLIDDKSLNGYESVLGISTNKVQGEEGLSDKVYHWLKGKFVP